MTMITRTGVMLLVTGVGLCLLAGASEPAPRFVASGRCLACHNQVNGPGGQELSIGTDWRATMMANAARDPYWQGSVRREVVENPGLEAAIEDKCASCHMPMSRYDAVQTGTMGSMFAHLAGSGDPAADQLAADGVSCALCHRIEAAGLGDPASYTAGFTIADPDPEGGRAYGPFEVDPGRHRVMHSSSTLRPMAGEHVQSSALCATCHTLFTHAYDRDGKEVGELAEQVPYLEWQHSDYREAMSCQDCHMPEATGAAPVTSVLAAPHDNVSRHVFRGGNFLMPRILDLHRLDLGVPSLPSELQVATGRTREHLQSSSASLEVLGVERRNGKLGFSIRVVNMAGHKLPTAYPSRRVWLHVTVRDVDGTLLFESGALGEDGGIAGNDNDEDPARYEPHHEVITTADQVQIYEPILGNPAGEVTTGLLRAVRYLKDNRLLPSGFVKESAAPEIAVSGAALGDINFKEGEDVVDFEVEVKEGRMPFSVDAELWYQPIGKRWAHNLDVAGAPEAIRFVSYYRQMARQSALLLTSVRASTLR